MSEDLGGDLGVYSAAANVKFQGAYSDRHFLTVSLSYTYSRYDFSSGAAPFSSMDKTSALAFYTTRIDERWGVFGIAGASFGAQAGESLWEGARCSPGARGVVLVLRKPYGRHRRDSLFESGQHVDRAAGSPS